MGLSPQSGHDTLRAAGRLLRVQSGMLRSSDRLNVMGGALLLARDARQLLGGRLPAELGGWADAIVRFTGMRSPFAARLLVDELYRSLRTGIDAQGVRLRPIASARPSLQLRRVLGPLSGSVSRPARGDYPASLWEPASPANYTPDRRPATHKIRYIVIHDTEGSCGSAVNWFQNAASQASAQYVVCRDGTIVQTVREKDVAWHAGNWPINQESIGIEHEGFYNHPVYTRAQYLASAALVRYLSKKYGIAPNRDTIFGHENVPNGGHIDPGPYWDWSMYMQQVRGDQAGYDTGMSAIASLTGEGYIHSCPAQSCPVLGSANWGEEFAVSSVKHGWDNISYGGSTGWIPRDATAAGSGQLLRVTAATNVYIGPGTGTGTVGTATRGQRYVAIVKDHNFWYAFFNHRYGFIPAGATRATACTLTTTDIPAACGGNPVPWLLVSPAFGPAHSVLRVQGANFTGTSRVTVQLGGQTLARVVTDTLGTFSVSAPLPASVKPAPLEVTTRDGAGVVAQTPFLVESPYHPRVSISSSSVRPGGVVVLTGNEYPVLQTLTVRATFRLATGGTQRVTVTGTTDRTGHFSVRLRVPATATGGKTQIVASVPGGTAGATIKIAGPAVIATPKPTPTATP